METLFVALRVLLSLAVVVALLWVLHRRLTRGTRERGSANPLSVVGRQSVGQKASVVVVDVGGQRFLLGVTEQTVNVLHSNVLSETDATESAGEFARTMAAAMPREPIVTDPAAAAHPARSAGNRRLSARVSGADARFADIVSILPQRDARSGTGLGGSILSPATWKQTAAALRRVM